MFDLGTEMNLLVRELINAGWVVLGYSIVATLLFRYLLPRLKPGWYNDIVNKVALAIIVYFVGTSTYRLFAAISLWSTRVGLEIPLYITAIMMVAATFALLGGLCMIRLFTPSRVEGNINNWPWFVTYLLVCLTIVVVWYVG